MKKSLLEKGKIKTKTFIIIRYPLSSYHVTTEDGYILKLYRISGGKNSKSEPKNQNEKKVVFMQHGLFVKK